MDILHILDKLTKIYGGDIILSDLIHTINNSEYIDIYADGSSYYDTNKKIRFSGIGVFFGDNDARNISKIVNNRTNGFAYNNNESEIIACIEGLKVVENINYYVNIYTDSRLVIDLMNGNCSSTKYNELYNELRTISDSFIKINWIHVNGHSGIYGNEEADRLSKKQYDSQ